MLYCFIEIEAVKTNLVKTNLCSLFLQHYLKKRGISIFNFAKNSALSCCSPLSVANQIVAFAE